MTEITTKEKLQKNLNFWLLDASNYSILKDMVMKEIGDTKELL